MTFTWPSIGIISLGLLCIAVGLFRLLSLNFAGADLVLNLWLVATGVFLLAGR